MTSDPEIETEREKESPSEAGATVTGQAETPSSSGSSSSSSSSAAEQGPNQTKTKTESGVPGLTSQNFNSTEGSSKEKEDLKDNKKDSAGSGSQRMDSGNEDWTTLLAASSQVPSTAAFLYNLTRVVSGVSESLPNYWSVAPELFDVCLLLGVARHGFDEWEKILEDVTLGWPNVRKLADCSGASSGSHVKLPLSRPEAEAEQQQQNSSQEEGESARQWWIGEGEEVSESFSPALAQALEERVYLLVRVFKHGYSVLDEGSLMLSDYDPEVDLALRGIQHPSDLSDNNVNPLSNQSSSSSSATPLAPQVERDVSVTNPVSNDDNPNNPSSTLSNTLQKTQQSIELKPHHDNLNRAGQAKDSLSSSGPSSVSSSSSSNKRLAPYQVTPAYIDQPFQLGAQSITTLDADHPITHNPYILRATLPLTGGFMADVPVAKKLTKNGRRMGRAPRISAEKKSQMELQKQKEKERSLHSVSYERGTYIVYIPMALVYICLLYTNLFSLSFLENKIKRSNIPTFNLSLSYMLYFIIMF